MNAVLLSNSEITGCDPKLVDARLGNTVRWYLAPKDDIDMRVPDDVRQCVVFIALPQAEEKKVFYRFMGTAFFVSKPSSDGATFYVYLVTAKHVANRLEGKPFLVRVNTKEAPGYDWIRGTGAKWWYHPADETVDVAVIPWAPPQHVEYRSIPESMFLLDETIRNKGIGIGDEVFITGLFTHLSGSKRNLPIVRIGNIAMMPEEPVPTELGNIEAYLIEARSIGGLSGSPAFVRHTVSLGREEFYLLGLMHGHWDIPPKEKNDAISRYDDALGKVNMGIAVVVPAKKILEVINHPELIDMRVRFDAKRLGQAMLIPDEKSQR